MSLPNHFESSLSTEKFPSILIIGHQLLFRSLLKNVLLAQFIDCNVLAVSRVEELETLQEGDLELVILTIPEENETELLNSRDRIAKARPTLPLVLLSERSDRAYASHAMACGFRALISTGTSVEIMLAALQLVLAGGSYFPTLHPGPQQNAEMHATRSGNARFLPQRTANIESSRPVGPETSASLTMRELEVLAQIRRGRPNKLIARDLSISENTAKMHVRRILSKLCVKNRTEAALVQQTPSHGLVDRG